ncbi:MAG: hypothetical protein O7C63_10105 [Alphaproteobacteria bacterium]|nr:hypothetical protein [Alphaproteobacteria bacterium]
MAKEDQYRPNPIFTAHFPETSGNQVNGLGETKIRQASPFFWHPHDRHEFGELQTAVIDYHRRAEGIREHYSSDAPRGPKPIAQVERRVEKSANHWTQSVKAFSLDNEGDLVGITAMDPLYVYEGYEIDEPWVIIVGVSMDHAELNKAPASIDVPVAGVEVARQYNRAARVCRELANFILAQGYRAKAWPGPFAGALSMIPAAIDAGLGELGKHGSLINNQNNRHFRASLWAHKPHPTGGNRL